MPNRCITSLHRFKRFTSKLTQEKTISSKTYICGSCHQQCESDCCQNRYCKRHQKEAYKPNTLITINITPLLSQLVSENFNNVSSHFRTSDTDCTKYTDLYDGRRLKQSKRDISQNSISLLINADGTPVFKSSKFSVWPLTCVVAELPPEKRCSADCMILIALWSGQDKPCFKIFLRKFVN